MTYRKLIDLKYGKGVTTDELMRRYPKQKQRVCEVALLEVPEETLKEVLQEETVLKKLVQLRKMITPHRRSA